MINNNTSIEEDEISKAFANPNRIRKILQKGIQAALLKHKQAGNPICEWQDNQVVWIAPEKINVKSTGKRG